MLARLMKFGALVKDGAVKHSTGLLTFGTVVGVGVSGYLWFRAGMKSTIKISNLEAERDEELTNKEMAKVIAKESIAPATVSVLTIGMIIASGIINIRRQKALSTALALSTEALSTYRDKVVETIGADKEHELRAKVAQEQVNEHFNVDLAYPTGHGNTLFMDGETNIFFRADQEWIRRQHIDILSWYTGGEDFISMNDWHGYLELPGKSEFWDYIGWNPDTPIDFDFTIVTAPNGEPCYVIDYTRSKPSVHPDILRYCPSCY